MTKEYMTQQATIQFDLIEADFAIPRVVPHS